MAITLVFPVLNQLFLVLAGFLQLRDPGADWNAALRAGAATPLNLALAQAASAGLLFMAVFPHKQEGGEFLAALQVRPLARALVGVCFLAGLGSQFALAEVGNLVQEVWPVPFDLLARVHDMLNPSHWWEGFTALLAFVVVAPVTEELLFRGWLLPSLNRQYGMSFAIMASSLLFGAVHLPGGPSAFAYATIGGFVLAAVAVRTNSTLGSIALHAGVNATPLLLPASVARIDGFNTLTEQVEHLALPVLLLATSVAAISFFFIWRMTKGKA